MSSRANQRAKLAERRVLRESGKKLFDSYQVDTVEDVYEEVDEEGYKKIIRSRLDQDDFVVDDNGEGYADDGREEAWDEAPMYGDSESDGDPIAHRRKQSKAAKKERENEQARREANDRDISQFFTKAANKPQKKMKVAKTQEDESFLADLLGEVDSNGPASMPRPAKRERSKERRRSRGLSIGQDVKLPSAKKTKVLDDRDSTPPAQVRTLAPGDDFEAPILEDGADIIMADDVLPSSLSHTEANNLLTTKDGPVDDSEEEMEVAHAGTVAGVSINLAASRPTNKPVKAAPASSPAKVSSIKDPGSAVDSSSWNRLTDQLNVVGSSQTESRGLGKLDGSDVADEDGSLHFFWTDYVEINGSLCLFGKVRNNKMGSFESCFVKIDNLLRNLYFLPRKHRMRSGQETEEDVTMADVSNEVDDLMTRMKVNMHKVKACERKYAFELPGIPKQAKYLKLLYPYTKPAIESDLSGDTYSHVFGANTALFEQFVLFKNIMGPCWLKIKNADFSTLRNASYCKIDVLVNNPDTISALGDSDGLDAPPLTLMSVALRTTFNDKDNKQEILAISARVYENVSLSDTTPAEKLFSRSFTLLRPNGTSFPFGFEALARKRNKGLIKSMKTEAEILSFFLAQLDIVDPDVVLGHQLEGVDYSILLNRLYERKVHQWSRIGRFRRMQWPGSIGRAGNNVFAERQIMAGRLLCDLSNECGKSTMYKCQTWSLTEMCDLYLSGDNRRRDFDNEVALKTWAATADGLMDYMTHMEADTYFIAALALRVQLLPLTKVLTNLAGNSWARTLTGTRAERNEYILLHEFHRNKYICPDKQTFRGRQQKVEEDDENAEGGKKKDKYKGGLVFEPEKGLYDKFVLVMDFNSLYPSIIQEFNICFTTVDRSASLEDGDAVPEVPTSQDQGILPKLIATLVNRRRQVKSLMRDKTATTEKLATWDIRQLALKLTANSMYGCLGYTKSRFYARPLAILTTHKGREILRSTKELAESRSLQVIYGDTDSVMINANVESMADALKVGNEFKKAVNERYTLLEIDIDNVFRRILLQAKKKYAAVNLVEQDGKYVEKLEVKGLDMKRREFCALSKEVSARLLQDILSGDDSEVSITRIHDYLGDIAAKMREGSIPMAKYTIFTQLGKAPKEYPNADSMPQVQVALRELARGKTVRKGDVIGYIITGDSKSSEPAPKRAYPPSDVKPGSNLSPDIEWYMAKQIFPPVERLCANIVGTSAAQLGEQLGLDVKKYAGFQNQHGQTGGEDVEIHPLESLVPDEIRFGSCARLSLCCRSCKACTAFEGLVASPSGVSAAGLLCGSCGSTMPMLSVVAQLEHALRQETTRYYEAWLACGDCGIRTRQMCVYGARCLGPKGLAKDCLGRMRYEYSEKAIYNQLMYFSMVFDVDKARAKAAAGTCTAQNIDQEGRDRILALAEHNRVRFGTLKGIVDRYLEKCGRQWVAMDALFAKLGFYKAA